MIGSGRAQTSMHIITGILKDNRNNLDALRLKGHVHYYNNDIEQALNHFKQVLRLDPDNKKSRTLLKMVKSIRKVKIKGNEAFSRGQYTQAIELYTECLEIDPSNRAANAILYNNRATCWNKKKEYQKALDDCQRSLELNERYTKAMLRKAQALQGLERYEEAVALMEKVVEIEPNSQLYQQELKSAKIELKRSKRINYYKVLGVDKDVTDKQLSNAFRKGAMKCHPDRFMNKPVEEQKEAEKRFKVLQEAHEVLKDPEMRRKYDAGYDLEEIKQGRGGMHGGMDMSEVFRMFQGGGGGGGFRSSRGGGPGGFSFSFG